MACCYGESAPELPFGWLHNDPQWVAQVFGQAPVSKAAESDQERIARRMAARGLTLPAEDPERHAKYGAPLANPWLPERHG
jgi:hypothetical protein